MKLQRKNKYDKYFSKGLLVLYSTSIFLSGCKMTNDVIDETINSEIICENDTYDTPALEGIDIEYVERPDALRMIELTQEEQEIAISELCISSESFKQQPHWSMVFKNDSDEYKIMFCEILLDQANNQYQVVDVFSGTYLFSFYDQGNGPYIMSKLDEIYDCIPYFEGAKILYINSLPMFTNRYNEIGVDCNFELMKKYFKMDDSGLINSNFTLDEVVQIYINLIPKELRVGGTDLGLVYDEDEKVYKLG